MENKLYTDIKSCELHAEDGRKLKNEAKNPTPLVSSIKVSTKKFSMIKKQNNEMLDSSTCR